MEKLNSMEKMEEFIHWALDDVKTRNEYTEVYDTKEEFVQQFNKIFCTDVRYVRTDKNEILNVFSSIDESPNTDPLNYKKIHKKSKWIIMVSHSNDFYGFFEKSNGKWTYHQYGECHNIF